MQKVIILDDDSMILEISKVTLQNAGYEVITIDNSLELNHYLSQDYYDLLITDIFMPNKEGMEIIQEVKEVYPSMKIIAMSGSVGYGDVLTVAKNLGSHQILSKPFSCQDLVDVVKETLEQDIVPAF